MRLYVCHTNPRWAIGSTLCYSILLLRSNEIGAWLVAEEVGGGVVLRKAERSEALRKTRRAFRCRDGGGELTGALTSEIVRQVVGFRGYGTAAIAAALRTIGLAGDWQPRADALCREMLRSPWFLPVNVSWLLEEALLPSQPGAAVHGWPPGSGAVPPPPPRHDRGDAA